MEISLYHQMCLDPHVWITDIDMLSIQWAIFGKNLSPKMILSMHKTMDIPVIS